MNEHLQPFEAAARLYCVNCGINPNNEIKQRHPLGLALPYTVPQWTLEAERLLDLSRMLSALRDVAQAEKVVVKS